MSTDKEFSSCNTCHEVNWDELAAILKGMELNDIDKISCESKKIERIFIKNLIDLRHEKGLTQQELATKTGLTQQAISSLEKCGRKPTLTNLIKYLLGLDININNLFENI